MSEMSCEKNTFDTIFPSGYGHFSIRRTHSSATFESQGMSLLYISISIIVVEVLVSQQSEEASEIARRNYEKAVKLFWSYGSDFDFLEV